MPTNGMTTHLTTKLRPFCQDEIEWLIANYPSKGSKFCAESLGRSPNVVRQKMASLEVRVSDEYKLSLARMRGRTDRKFETFNVSPAPFQKPASPEMAYLLGLLWADGHISHSQHVIAFSMSCSHWEELATIFHSLGKWHVVPIRRLSEKHAPSVKVSTNGKALYQILAAYGYESKSGGSPDTVIAAIPEQWRGHWYRGFYDGDGCVYVNAKHGAAQISFASVGKQDWNFLRNLLAESHFNVQDCDTYSVCRCTSAVGVRAFMDYIYKIDDGIGFSDKRNRFDALKTLRNGVRRKRNLS